MATDYGVKIMIADPLGELVDAARHGDGPAINALVLETQVEVLRLCAHLGSQDDAEDLAQDAYLRAFDSLHKFRGESQFRSWLLAIARNVCADYVRTRVRHRRIDALRVPVPESAVSLAGEVEWSNLLDQLDDDQRIAFVLTALMGMEYSQAAEICNCPVGTIRSRVSRARAHLLVLHRGAESA